MDDGADLVNELHTKRTELLDGVVGGTEETTTGVIRLRAMAKDGVLRYPIVAVNEALYGGPTPYSAEAPGETATDAERDKLVRRYGRLEDQFAAMDQERRA